MVQAFGWLPRLRDSSFEVSPPVSDDQYKQLHSWLTDLDHVVRGNGTPGLKERMATMEQAALAQGKEVSGIKAAMEKRSDRQWYLTLTILAAIVVDIAQHWGAAHIK